MNYMKIFLAAILLVVSQQTFCMFFPSELWRNEGVELKQDHYIIHEKPDAFNTIAENQAYPMINFENIKKYENSKVINQQLARKAKKAQEQADAQAQADARAKAAAKAQAKAAQKQRAALDQQISAAETKVDLHFFGKGKRR